MRCSLASNPTPGRLKMKCVVVAAGEALLPAPLWQPMVGAFAMFGDSIASGASVTTDRGHGLSSSRALISI